MRLEAGVCVLRPWAADDLRPLVQHANNRRVWVQLRNAFPYPYTEADARSWLEFSTTGGRDENFAVEVDGQAVGGIGYTPGGDVNRFAAELGYWIGEAHWGRGIATAAVAALSSYIFQTKAVCRVFAYVFGTNPASRRVLEKTGYVHEGLLRSHALKDGRFLDVHIYGRVDPTAAERIIARGERVRQ
jgi:RimJ/RimL family protein N-acetyltransferase